MKKLIRSFWEKIQQWMDTRHGIDELTCFLLGLSLVLLLASLMFIHTSFSRGGCIAAIIITAWSLIRSFSKDSVARNGELEAYLALKDEVNYKVTLKRNVHQLRKAFRYYECKACGTRFRLTKEKDNVPVCPNCGNQDKKKLRRKRR